MARPKTNSEIGWTFRYWPDDFEPPVNTPIYILVEQDQVDPEQYPFVRKAVMIKSNDPVIEGRLRWEWKLIDFDPETEEEILHQYYTVIGWRLTEEE